jgi:competence protein ComEA
VNRRIILTVVSVVLVIVGFNWSRFTPEKWEPAFLIEQTGVWVQLGDGFSKFEIFRQFNDGSRLKDVIGLTGLSVATVAKRETPLDTILESGQRINIDVQGAEIQSIYLNWMTAGQRVALGIPLHPDRMTQMDWEFLPGVGVKTAAGIEQDRQINGDFKDFLQLRRVDRIGPGKIKDWMEFF